MDDDASASELSCPICKGYLIDAVTLTRCSHSFCRACLLLKLQNDKRCPSPDCDNKFEDVGQAFCRDKTLQSFVFKFMPSTYLKEIKQRADFIKRRLPNDEERRMIVNWNVTDFGQYLCVKDEMVSLCIEHVTRQDILNYSRGQTQPSTSEDGTAIVTSPSRKSEFIRYFRCPAAVKIKHLKTLLEGKLELPDNYILYFIELDSEEIIEESYSIQDLIYIFGWSRQKPFQLHFTLTPLVSDEDKPPILEVEEVIDQVEQEDVGPPQLETESPSKMPAFTVNISTSLFDKKSNGNSPSGLIPRMPIITSAEAPPKKKRRLGPRKDKGTKRSTSSAVSSAPMDLSSQASPSSTNFQKVAISPLRTPPQTTATNGFPLQMLSRSPSKTTDSLLFRFTPPETSPTAPTGKSSSSPSVLTVEQSNKQLSQVFAPFNSAPPTPLPMEFSDRSNNQVLNVPKPPSSHPGVQEQLSLARHQLFMEAVANGTIKLPQNSDCFMLQKRPSFLAMPPSSQILP